MTARLAASASEAQTVFLKNVASGQLTHSWKEGEVYHEVHVRKATIDGGNGSLIALINRHFPCLDMRASISNSEKATTNRSYNTQRPRPADAWEY